MRGHIGAHSESSLTKVFQFERNVVFFFSRYFLGIEARFCELMYEYVLKNKIPWPKPRPSNILERGLTSFVRLKDWHALRVKFHWSAQCEKVVFFQGD